MSGWRDAKETLPPEGDTIDVWQAWVNSATGETFGRRLTNAWVHDGRVLHGDHGTKVRFYTYWMPVPEAPE